MGTETCFKSKQLLETVFNNLKKNYKDFKLSVVDRVIIDLADGKCLDCGKDVVIDYYHTTAAETGRVPYAVCVPCKRIYLSATKQSVERRWYDIRCVWTGGTCGLRKLYIKMTGRTDLPSVESCYVCMMRNIGEALNAKDYASVDEMVMGLSKFLHSNYDLPDMECQAKKTIAQIVPPGRIRELLKELTNDHKANGHHIV